MSRIPGADRQPGLTTRPAEFPAAVRPAAPPEPPPLSRPALRSAEEHTVRRVARETLERQSTLRGLILLAILLALVAVFHTGLRQALPSEWWRQW